MILIALHNLMHIQILIMILLGVAGGIAIGALPGLSATMGVSLLLPLTFGMDVVPGILLLIGIYIGAIYGGSISAILLGTPGTPAAAATIVEGYTLTEQGKSGKALTISTVSSFIGGTISAVILTLVSPQLAKFALKFTAHEYFALAIFGLSIISGLAGKSIVKGLISGVIGLLIALVGIDPITGVMRYTFGSVDLLAGFSFIPVMIGLFALSRIYTTIENFKEEDSMKNIKVSGFQLSKKEFKQILPTIFRSSIIGTIIGSIPGAGGDIGAFIGYNEAKRFTKHPEEFGHGSIEGVAAPESANNAVTGGAMIPLLTLGIPGGATAAVLLGALMMQGLQPGPLLFTDNGPLVYTIFLGIIVANFAMLILGLCGVKFFTKVTDISKGYLFPVIFVLCIVGSYAINNNIFDVYVMFAFGIVGYLMSKIDIPTAPIVLAIILGPMAESNLRRGLVMANGHYSSFLTRPISATFIILAIITLFAPIIKKNIKEYKEKKRLKQEKLKTTEV